MAAHFNLQDHSLDDLKVMGIEKIWNNDTDRRKLRERFWILDYSSSVLANQIARNEVNNVG